MSEMSEIDQVHLRAVMLFMSEIILIFNKHLMSEMSEIDQVHLRAVMLFMSEMSEIVIIFNIHKMYKMSEIIIIFSIHKMYIEDYYDLRPLLHK